VVKAVDKSNGYVYGALTQGNESIMTVAEQDKRSLVSMYVAMLPCILLTVCREDIKEKYMTPSDATILGTK
jgi:hypothetical protein